MRYHALKIEPKYFDRVKECIKTFEIRKNDRDFQVGDAILLQEWHRDYTGLELNVTIIYLLQNIDGLDKDYCILGITLNE